MDNNFFMEDYKLKISYLNDQFSRMWTRFNFFLTIESGLVAGQVFAKKADVFNITDIHWALVFISLLWYVFGAQDKYLVDNYRDQVEDAFDRLKAITNNEFHPINHDIPYVGQVRMKDFKANRKIKKQEKDKDIGADFSSLAAWRFREFSITHLAAYVPFLLILLWTAVLLFDYSS